MTNRELEIQWLHCAFMKIWSIMPKYASDTLPSPIRQIGAGACFLYLHNIAWKCTFFQSVPKFR